MEDEKKSASTQIYPSKVRIVPNFKLTKVTSNLSNDNYKRLVNGEKGTIIEKKKHKKHGDIYSTYTISNVEGYDNTDPLNEFDYSVASVCISELAAGNTRITTAMILRGLTGRTRETHNGAVRVNQQDAILNSLNKLMGTVLTVDLTDANKKLNYDCPNKITENLLHCKYITAIINGQIIDDAVYLTDESPLMTIAKARGQLLTYDVSLLDVPNQNNTPLVIMLKNYSIKRVFEIILHNMTPTLTLDDIFRKCKIENSSRKAKMDARDTLDKFFNHLKARGVIESYEWIKQGNKIHGIKFTYTKKKSVQPPTSTQNNSETTKTSATQNNSEKVSAEIKKDTSETKIVKSDNPLAQVFSKPKNDIKKPRQDVL